ncbi:MAG TPA: NADP-dependent oxidoreductase [Candidatus Saccharimonadales bacterium]
MKAAQISSYDGPDSIKINDAAKPEADEGQVLVEVRAAAINPFDVKVSEGAARQMAELDFPATLGGDVAGSVASVGSGVTSFEPGQAVYGQAGALSGQGSFAEFTPVKADQLAAKPASLDFATAAALPLVSVSAYQALVDHINLQPGQKILIHGGAGGIGSMAIQLAKHLGAYVATTAGATEAEFVKNLGADVIIDYQHSDFAEQLKDYDAVFDTVGGETNRKSYAVLKPGGAFVSMVAPADEELVKQYDVRYTSQFTHVTTERLAKIAELADSGELTVHIDKSFPLDQAAEAMKYQATAHPRGKVVIQVKD